MCPCQRVRPFRSNEFRRLPQLQRRELQGHLSLPRGQRFERWIAKLVVEISFGIDNANVERRKDVRFNGPVPTVITC